MVSPTLHQPTEQQSDDTESGLETDVDQDEDLAYDPQKVEKRKKRRRADYARSLVKAQRACNMLKDAGWHAVTGTLSEDGEKREEHLGVIVKIGDDRLSWEPYERNPVIDFFSIANIAHARKSQLAMKPVGYEWRACGVDTIEITNNKGEDLDTFAKRLISTNPQLSFEFSAVDTDKSRRAASSGGATALRT